MTQLTVYLHGEFIGTLERGNGNDFSFSYTQELIETAEPRAVVLSNSLPVRDEPFDPIETRAFFDGLLPEDRRRDEIARRLKVSSQDAFQFLAELGKDCAGAVVILPEGAEIPDKGGAVEWLTDEALAELVVELPRRPLGLSDSDRGMRLSLAGVQRKLTLIRSGSGRFGKPKAEAPSTHVIKPQYGDDEFPDVVYNENFCMRIAECVGLPTARTELRQIGNRPCLVSERFDRGTDGQQVIRLHQEDLCQALGISPNLKYQGDGGPGFRQFRELLHEVGRATDVETLVRAAVFNFVIGNSDAHGKNFALLFGELGRELAPLYDLVSTAVYPELAPDMAMGIGDVFSPEAVQEVDWVDMSSDVDLPVPGFLDLVRRTGSQTLACAEQVAKLSQTEGWHRPIIDEIVEVCRRRCELMPEPG